MVANNADRKSGHCILGDDGTVWAIDHGLCFHREPKLRTVIWEFAGEDVPTGLLDDLHRTRTTPYPRRWTACCRRPRSKPCAVGRGGWSDRGRFPVPDPDPHRYPWPLV